ncbi:hypothetical protein NH340_JMT02728 [Sarcoptes scabiei]|nr:hypothetical protein NH340_JMT02728 [Sarcoptes scabiei]
MPIEYESMRYELQNRSESIRMVDQHGASISSSSSSASSPSPPPRSSSLSSLESKRFEQTDCLVQNDNDLTNLNWLQDHDLLKKFYGTDHGNLHQNQNGIIINKQIKIANLEKPPFSYSALIFMAIESSSIKCMMVRQIYKWIVDNFPYFATASTGWKNTIRHTLSLRKCFKKISVFQSKLSQSKYHNPIIDSLTELKGSYWVVDPQYRSLLQQQIVSFSTKNKIITRLYSDFDSNRFDRKIQFNQNRVKILDRKNQTNNDYNHQFRSRKTSIGWNLKVSTNKTSTSSIDRYAMTSILVKDKTLESYQPILLPQTQKTEQQFRPLAENRCGCLVINPFSIRFFDPKSSNANENNRDGSVNGTDSNTIANNCNPHHNLVSVINVNQSPKLYAPIPTLNNPISSRSSSMSMRTKTISSLSVVDRNCQQKPTIFAVLSNRNLNTNNYCNLNHNDCGGCDENFQAKISKQFQQAQHQQLNQQSERKQSSKILTPLLVSSKQQQRSSSSSSSPSGSFLIVSSQQKQSSSSSISIDLDGEKECRENFLDTNERVRKQEEESHEENQNGPKKVPINLEPNRSSSTVNFSKPIYKLDNELNRFQDRIIAIDNDRNLLSSIEAGDGNDGLALLSFASTSFLLNF